MPTRTALARKNDLCRRQICLYVQEIGVDAFVRGDERAKQARDCRGIGLGAELQNRDLAYGEPWRLK